MSNSTLTTDDQLLYRVEDAARKLDLGRSTVFELIAAGQIETVQIGRSRRVPAQALVAYVDRLRGTAATSAA